MERGIARQYLHTFAFALARVFSHALLIVMLGRTLSLEDYAAYALVAAAIPVAVTALGLELYAYLAREIPGLPGEEGVALFKGAFRFQVLAAVALVALVLVTGLDGALASALKLSGYRIVVRLGLVVFLFAYLQRELARYFIAVKRIEISNISQFICTNSWVYLLIIIVVMRGRLALPLIFGLWIAGGAASVLYGMAQVSRRGFFREKAARRVVTKGLAFSVPLFMGAIGFQINNVSGRYIISLFRPLAEAGGFSFLQTLVTIGGPLTYNIIEAILRPRIVEAHNLNDQRRRDILVNRLLRYSWLLVLPVMVVLLGAGRELLLLISQPGYLRFLGLVPYFAATGVIAATLLPFSTILFLQRRTRLMGGINLAGAAGNVGLALLLVPRLGAPGAALAGLAAIGGVLVASYACTRQAGRVVTTGRSRLPQVAASAAAMAAAMAAVRLLWTRTGAVGGAPVGLLLLGGVGSVAFAVVVWVAGGLEPVEKCYLRGMLRRPAQSGAAKPESEREARHDDA